MSRNFIECDDFSHVNLTVGWESLRWVTNLSRLSEPIPHKKKISSMNLHHLRGYFGKHTPQIVQKHP